MADGEKTLNAFLVEGDPGGHLWNRLCMAPGRPKAVSGLN
jgi:hypothetical protein